MNILKYFAEYIYFERFCFVLLLFRFTLYLTCTEKGEIENFGPKIPELITVMIHQTAGKMAGTLVERM